MYMSMCVTFCCASGGSSQKQPLYNLHIHVYVCFTDSLESGPVKGGPDLFWGGFGPWSSL